MEGCLSGILPAENDLDAIAHNPHDPPARPPPPSIEDGDGHEPDLDVDGARLERGGGVGPDVGVLDDETEGERGGIAGALAEGRERGDGERGGGREEDGGEGREVGDGELAVGVCGEEGGVEGGGEGGVGRGVGDTGQGEGGDGEGRGAWAEQEPDDEGGGAKEEEGADDGREEVAQAAGRRRRVGCVVVVVVRRRWRVRVVVVRRRVMRRGGVGIRDAEGRRSRAVSDGGSGGVPDGDGVAHGGARGLCVVVVGRVRGRGRGRGRGLHAGSGGRRSGAVLVGESRRRWGWRRCGVRFGFGDQGSMDLLRSLWHQRVRRTPFAVCCGSGGLRPARDLGRRNTRRINPVPFSLEQIFYSHSLIWNPGREIPYVLSACPRPIM
jgi:hypothetical protein